MLATATLSRLPAVCARFPRIAIVGLDDEANDVVSRIFQEGRSGAQCIAVNNDEEYLTRIYAHEKLLIDTDVTPGAGKSCDSEGEGTAIRKCADLITPLLTGADVAFIVAEMSERNRVSEASVVADVARRTGAVTVGVAIMPSPFQVDPGLVDRHGLAKMRETCHTLAIVDNNRSMRLAPYLPNLSSDSSDTLVVDMLSGLSETLACPSALNIDLAVFRERMMDGGIAHLGIARSSSPLRVEEATIGALRGSLLYDNIARSRGAVLIVRGDSSLTIEEAGSAAQLVAERAGWNLPIVMGASVDDSQHEGCQVSILLTGGVYPYIPGGYRRLPLDMYEMEPGGEEDGPIDIELDLHQLEES
jgi:cell division protein FtsZ